MTINSKHGALDNIKFQSIDFPGDGSLKKSSIIKSTYIRDQNNKYYRENLAVIFEAVITVYNVCNKQKLELNSLDFSHNGRIVHLTARQSECLTHLAMGKSIKKIALLLGCSPSNIEDHICRLKQKIGLYTTDALIDFFWKKHLTFNLIFD